MYIHAACSEHCNQGNMRCFGHTPEECCNFYDPHNNDKCLDECPLERQLINDSEDFYCTGLHSFYKLKCTKFSTVTLE